MGVNLTDFSLIVSDSLHCFHAKALMGVLAFVLYFAAKTGASVPSLAANAVVEKLLSSNFAFGVCRIMQMELS